MAVVVSKSKLLFALCLIIIFIVVILAPDQRGVISGILIATCYILIELFGGTTKSENFEYAEKLPTMSHNEESYLPQKSYCDGYQGAIECADEDDEDDNEEANLDNKNKKLAHDRFRYKREVDGVVSKRKMSGYLTEEVEEAEEDRWEGNEEY